MFALKMLCGFDVREIALRLFASEANIYKRFSRARSRLRELSPSPAAFADALHESKLPAVHKTLYLLFTEGYLSFQPETAIRRELCEEAIGLGTILVQHPVGSTPETYALHPAFGKLTNAEWDAFNLRHSEMHMSFVVPN